MSPQSQPKAAVSLLIFGAVLFDGVGSFEFHKTSNKTGKCKFWFVSIPRNAAICLDLTSNKPFLYSQCPRDKHKIMLLVQDKDSFCLNSDSNKINKTTKWF